ncbi:MAG: ABC transporter permease [Polyangiales bacterium]|nr:ABC transporter permease [Sandaracinaceae bacterium]
MKRLLARLGLVLVGGFFVLGVVGPWLAPRDPQAIDLAHQFEAPSSGHWLGTADNGVDLLSALLHGARLASVVSLSVVCVSVVVGVLLGALAGYLGGRVDHALSAVTDVFQAFPGILLNIAILALVAEPGLLHLIVALSVSGWVLYARVARAATLSLKQLAFVDAARALGASDVRILLRHIVPNLAGPIVIQATAGLGGVILAESTLSFLGLGPGVAVSWGALLDQGSSVLLRFPHVALISGGCIAVTVLGFQLAGDALRDTLDPRG